MHSCPHADSPFLFGEAGHAQTIDTYHSSQDEGGNKKNGEERVEANEGSDKCQHHGQEKVVIGLCW